MKTILRNNVQAIITHTVISLSISYFLLASRFSGHFSEGQSSVYSWIFLFFGVLCYIISGYCLKPTEESPLLSVSSIFILIFVSLNTINYSLDIIEKDMGNLIFYINPVFTILPLNVLHNFSSLFALLPLVVLFALPMPSLMMLAGYKLRERRNVDEVSL